MKKFLLVLTLPLLVLAFTTHYPETSENYPQNYFRSPVAHTVLLSGTFGELRPNHFHSGIDIKSSKGVAGDPIYAAADGYIAKIRIEESGYGRSLYVNHPNGYTTVYAHLDKFTDELENYLKEQQYARKSYEVELLPGADKFRVAQGEQIGTMGNTGASNGAHLHFEVRKTKTQNPVNPLLFGFNVTDNIAPKMHSLKVYFLNDKREAKDEKAFTLFQSGGNYRLKGDTLTLGAWRAGFALKVYDHFDRVSNWNGIYSLEMYLDDSLVYDFELESFSFEETRYINAHCDYEERLTKNSYFNRCYTLPGNRLSIVKHQENYGVIDLFQGRPHKITLVASDVAGNKSNLTFWVKRSEALATSVAQETYNYIFPYNEGNLVQTDGIYLHMPEGTLYENLYLKYMSTPERSSGYYSKVHHLHDSRTPVHGYFDLGIRPTLSIPAELKSKVFVAYCEGNSVVNCGGYWQEGFLRTKVRALGDYAIMVDQTPPSVKPIAFQTNMKGFNKMSFKISDNVSAASNVEGLTYEAQVDGQWILMEFDKKTALLSHRFDDQIGKGEHELVLTVRDAVGNETVLERKFVR
jgi:hypothetical protein